MSRPGKETLFGHVQYATLGDVWITFVIAAVSWVGFSIVCLGIGIVLEMFGVPNRVLRWILPVAYLAFLAVTPWILARKAEYRLLLVDVRFWIMLMALAICPLNCANRSLVAWRGDLLGSHGFALWGPVGRATRQNELCAVPQAPRCHRR